MRRPSKGRSLIAKRSVLIEGRKTSMTLEQPFWTCLKEIAAHQGTSLNHLVARIDSERLHPINLSSATRLFVLNHYRTIAEARSAKEEKSA
jgi:predicted DNA-binding ribbon-helix-helix protein